MSSEVRTNSKTTSEAMRIWAPVIELLQKAIKMHHAQVSAGRSPSSKRTTREDARLLAVALVGVLPFRRIVFGSGEGDLEEDEDRPADEDFEFLGRLSADRSDCQSMPCCCLS